jgi:hypothetical protein
VNSRTRHLAVIAAVVAAVVVSTPLRRLAAQGSSAGMDLLYGWSAGSFDSIDPSTHTVTSVGSYCTHTSGAQFYDIPGSAPDGTLYGFSVDCDRLVAGTWWSRLDPDTGTVTRISLAPSTVNWSGQSVQVAFFGTFGTPGSILGYRIQQNGNGTKTTFGDWDLYAVDYLSPYQEHLVASDIAPNRANFGLGTAVSDDGSSVFYVTTDAVYKWPTTGASASNVTQIGFLTFSRLSKQALVTGNDSSGHTFYIADGATVFPFDSTAGQVGTSFQATPLTQIQGFTMRRSPWGGVRIEPDHGLATTRSGGTATFTAVLTAQPTANVTVGFTSSNVHAGQPSPSSITFTPSSWNTPQTVALVGVDDGGTSSVPYVITSTTSSADANYINRSVVQVSATNSGTFVASPPSPAVPPAFGPSISGIANQTIPIGGSVTVGFRVSGAFVPAALRVFAGASDVGLVPPLSPSCDGSGACTLTVSAADGRAGATTITVSVTDGFTVASTVFTLTVGDGIAMSVPGPASRPVATQSGSGAVLTWSAPDTGAPQRYAIVMGTHSGFFDLPTVLTPDASLSYVVPSLPPGPYFFRVFAITDAGLGPGSDEASFTVTNPATIPGPPRGLMGILSGSTATLAWLPPIIGGPPAAYSVERGSSPGRADVTTVVTATSQSTPLDAGTYWFRVRAISGGATGAASNEMSLPVGASTCSAAPGTPVLLPVSKIDGQAIFSWQPTGTASVTRYRLEISDGATITILTTAGVGSSFVWNMSAGSFAARVIADNDCGSSARSNAVSF